MTAKVIALEGGVLGFVDPWRGVALVSDIVGRKKEHELPLPQHLIRPRF